MRLPGFLSRFEELRDAASGLFHFSARERRIALMIIGGAVLATSVAVTVIIVSSGAAAGVGGKKAGITEDAGSETGVSGKKAFYSDFILPENHLEESMTGIIFSREPQTKWTEEQIDEYWIDPEEIVTDLPEKEAEKVIRDIFADVP